MQATSRHLTPREQAALRRAYRNRYRTGSGALFYVLAALALPGLLAATIIGTALAGDPHGYAYDLAHGRACHAMLGRGCKSDPTD